MKVVGDEDSTEGLLNKINWMLQDRKVTPDTRATPDAENNIIINCAAFQEVIQVIGSKASSKPSTWYKKYPLVGQIAAKSSCQ